MAEPARQAQRPRPRHPRGATRRGRAGPAQPDVRVVVIQGKGDSFCAGLDFAAAGKSARRSLARFALPNPLRGTNGFQECFWAWRSCRCRSSRSPAVTSSAAASSSRSLRLPVLDAGLPMVGPRGQMGSHPGHERHHPAGRTRGRRRGQAVDLTGEIISGEQAIAYGLATGVGPDPIKLAHELIDAIIARSPDSVAASEAAAQPVRRGGVRAAFARERRSQLAMFRTKNAAIARKAGMGRRSRSSGPEVRMKAA